MRVAWMIPFAVALPAVGWTVGAGAESSPAPGASPAAQASAGPVVSERAEQLLKQMGDYIGSASQFTFHADITFDHVLPSDQKLQYAAGEDVALRRPGGVYVEWSGDLGNRQFWYDGTSITLFDPSTNFYASESAPADIDAMLEKTVMQLGFSPPLADLLYRDPYKVVRTNVQFGLYLGATQVNGRSCDALAFVEQDIDWQIWIDTGPQLTPCKLVITYKNQPSQPQFSAVFTAWDFDPRIADAVFKPQLPPGTKKITFAPVTASASPK